MSQEWKDDKAKSELTFLDLPHIVDGQITITESVAVHQYIALKGNRPEVLGKTPQDKANRYRIQSLMYDSFMKWFGLTFKPGSTRQIIADKGIEVNTQFHDYLGNKKFLCGDTPSIADFILLEATEYLEKIVPGCVASALPKLIEHRDRMLNLPEIKKYMKTKEYQDCIVQFVPDVPFVKVWINDKPQTNLPKPQ